jgi:hypothetical protein
LTYSMHKNANCLCIDATGREKLIQGELTVLKDEISIYARFSVQSADNIHEVTLLYFYRFIIIMRS